MAPSTDSARAGDDALQAFDVGRLLSFLKRKHVLIVLAAAGSLAAALSTTLLAGQEWNGLRAWMGVIAVVAVVADRIADVYDKRRAANTFRESERSAERAIDNLNVLLSEAIDILFLRGAARTQAVAALRRAAAKCAALAVGDGSRATYYSLTRLPGGTRKLGQPRHHATLGRYDKPNRPFIEKESPDLSIWKLMDREDDEAEVRSAPDPSDGVQWQKKKYDTFVSIPVKAQRVELGLLSVNNASVGSIGGPQRAAVLGMARTMALVIALEKGPDELKKQLNHYAMSDARDTFQVGEETESER